MTELHPQLMPKIVIGSDVLSLSLTFFSKPFKESILPERKSFNLFRTSCSLIPPIPPSPSTILPAPVKPIRFSSAALISICTFCNVVCDCNLIDECTRVTQYLLPNDTRSWTAPSALYETTERIQRCLLQKVDSS
jgi:hypothetical protein